MRKRLATAVLILALGGCAGPARRPEPGADPGTLVSTYVAGGLSGGSAMETLPGPGGAPTGIGMTHTAGAAGSQAGAGSASGAAASGLGVSALVIGNVALVGIDPNVIPGGPGSGQVISDVRARVLDRFPQFDAVFVTTDPARVAQIANLHGQIRDGTSAVTLMDDIQSVVRAVRE